MKKYKINASYILIAMLMSCSLFVNAQHDHSSHGASHEDHIDEPPHRGDLKELGKYKIELVANLYLKENSLTLYLYKGNLKPLSIDGITGTITINYKDGTSSTATLTARGTESFVAQLQKTEPFSCIVTVIIKEKTFSTIFNHKGLE